MAEALMVEYEQWMRDNCAFTPITADRFLTGVKYTIMRLMLLLRRRDIVIDSKRGAIRLHEKHYLTTMVRLSKGGGDGTAPWLNFMAFLQNGTKKTALDLYLGALADDFRRCVCA